MTPFFCTEIVNSFNEFDQKNSINSSEFKKIDLDVFLKPIMQIMFSILMFGKRGIEKHEKYSEFYHLSDDIMVNLYGLFFNPLYILFPEVSTHLRLPKQLRAMKKSRERLREIMKLELEDRMKRDDSEQEECIFDRIVAHNKACIRENKLEDLLKDEELDGAMNLFMVAGTDSPEVISKMAICHMADKENLQELVGSFCEDLYGKTETTERSKIETNKKLQFWLKETLRMHNSISQTGMRRAKKDVQLKNLSIRKGDLVSIMVTALSYDESAFPDSANFDINRFSDENAKNLNKFQYLPFGGGKRNCMGKYLGELLVTLIVTQFARCYEFKKPANHEYYTRFLTSNRVINPEILIKRK